MNIFGQWIRLMIFQNVPDPFCCYFIQGFPALLQPVLPGGSKTAKANFILLAQQVESGLEEISQYDYLLFTSHTLSPLQ